ncbi:hypothetical protein FDP41_009809 [Naegleria fowleri]|uniref:Protein kinase domain-containing protein n=1 Tax=Naegleria fowleri TaxID=5763 RepID=A0A6A5AVQ5_NAEFO|nr:uncharacterized protein FDP41_009809 [Naegleria fowleri]KAF0972113.1 hypothetical protein FDP41_009809 [Naegleria fowleri]
MSSPQPHQQQQPHHSQHSRVVSHHHPHHDGKSNNNHQTSTTIPISDDYFHHPPHSHSHVPLVSVPTYCSHRSDADPSSTIGSPLQEQQFLVATTSSPQQLLFHGMEGCFSTPLQPLSSTTTTPVISNNNIPSFNCPSCPTSGIPTTTTTTTLNHHGYEVTHQQQHSKKRKLSTQYHHQKDQLKSLTSLSTSPEPNCNHPNTTSTPSPLPNLCDHPNNIKLYGQIPTSLSNGSIHQQTSTSSSSHAHNLQNRSCAIGAQNNMRAGCPSYEVDSIPTRLFMGEQVRVRIHEIPSILQQFQSMCQSSDIYHHVAPSLENLTICFQKEGLFNIQMPCYLEGTDFIVFRVPSRETFLPFMQQDGNIITNVSPTSNIPINSSALHHCAVTISARNNIPNGGDCLMILMHQACCSIVCMETCDMINLVGGCFGQNPKRLRDLLIQLKERYSDDFGAMLHAEDEHPLTYPFRSLLRIGKEIGKGSNGFVYVVERRKDLNTSHLDIPLWISKKLALKQCFFTNPVKVQEYVTMHRAIMEISKNPESHIVDIYDIQTIQVEESNTHVVEIVMQKMGFDLYSYTRRYLKGSLSLNTLKTLFSIIKQTVNGIRSIHMAGYCHLDIKEGNIMLNRDKTVKLIDFDFSTNCNAVLTGRRGTLLYLSPEMANIKESSKPIDKCDVWSLGVVILNIMRKVQQFKKYDIVKIASKDMLVDDDHTVFIVGNAKEQSSVDTLIEKVCHLDPSFNRDSEFSRYMHAISQLLSNMLKIDYHERYSVNELWNFIEKISKELVESV